MSNKLYVGNISFQMDEQALKDTFAAFGTVSSVKIITDFETGRSKGFGFVEMENADQAQACIENLDGQEVGGRAIRVNVAKERAPRR
jgi:RNA recognition motif-containing protein